MLKGIFVPAAFSGMGQRLECLHAECQLSWMVPCLANLRPCRVLECSPACPTLSSIVSTIQRVNDGYPQAEPLDGRLCWDCGTMEIRRRHDFTETSKIPQKYMVMAEQKTLKVCLFLTSTARKLPHNKLQSFCNNSVCISLKINISKRLAKFSLFAPKYHACKEYDSVF